MVGKWTSWRLARYAFDNTSHLIRPYFIRPFERLVLARPLGMLYNTFSELIEVCRIIYETQVPNIYSDIRTLVAATSFRQH